MLAVLAERTRHSVQQVVTSRTDEKQCADDVSPSLSGHFERGRRRRRSS